MEIVRNAVLAHCILCYVQYFFTINVEIVIYVVYSHWYLKKYILNTDLPIQTTIY